VNDAWRRPRGGATPEPAPHEGLDEVASSSVRQQRPIKVDTVGPHAMNIASAKGTPRALP